MCTQGVQQSVPTPTLYVVCLVLKCGTTTASNPRAAAVSLAVCSQRGAIRRVGQHVQRAVSPPHGGTLKYIVWTLFFIKASKFHAFPTGGNIYRNK